VSRPIARTSSAALVLVLLTLASLGSGLATAERSGRAGVIVSLDGSVSPHGLPRHRAVPVSLTLAGTIHGSDGSRPPHLARIELAFGARGGFSTAGLPRCPRARLRNATQRQALARCGRALVGRGTILNEVPLAPDSPLLVRADVLAFNAEVAGRPAVWVHAYSDTPPVSYVLPFYVRRLHSGAYGVLLRAPVLRALGRWPRLRSFEITFGRRYRARGARRSYLSARCPLPPRFDAGYFPLARATYHFAPAPNLTTTILRGCRALD